MNTIEILCNRRASASKTAAGTSQRTAHRYPPVQAGHRRAVASHCSQQASTAQCPAASRFTPQSHLHGMRKKIQPTGRVSHLIEKGDLIQSTVEKYKAT